MIALPSRDEVPPLRLAPLDKILPCQFDRGFDRLRAAADEIDIAEAAGFVADEIFGKRFRGLGRKERGVGEREP